VSAAIKGSTNNETREISVKSKREYLLEHSRIEIGGLEH
jgi:hypothetical protein